MSRERAHFDDERTALLRRRLTGGFWLIMAGSAFLLMADVVLRPDQVLSLAPPKLFLLVTLAVCFQVVRRSRSPQILRWTGVVMTSATYLATALASAQLANSSRAPLIFTVVVMGTTVMPWGIRPQLVSVASAWLALALDLSLLRAAGVDLEPSGYPSVALLAASLTSIYAAVETDRSHRERRRAEEALHARAQAEQDARISGLLAGIARELSTSLETRAILETLCDLTIEALGADVVLVLFRDGEAGAFEGRRRDRGSVAAAVEPIPASAVGPLLARLETAGVLDLDATDVRRALGSLRPPGVEGHVGAPLRAGPTISGAILVADRVSSPGAGDRHLTLQGIAQIASTALANARLVEQLERTNRIKSEFVSTMSHELRTPLHLIIGNAEMLEDHGLDASERAACVAGIARASRELGELIENTLEIARFESRRSGPVLEPVVLGPLWREFHEACSPIRRRPGVDLLWIPAEPDDRVVVVDRRRLAIVMRNLVGNALKFTERGAVRAEAHLSGDVLEVAVADTGIGIPRDRQAEVFDMFHQIDGSDSRAFGGSGLGLYIVHQIVSELGGEVMLDSAPGRGSTFTVRIPAGGSPRTVGNH